MDIEMAAEAGGRGEQLSSLALRCAERLSVSFGDFFRELVAPLIYEGRPMPDVPGMPVSGLVDGILPGATIWVKAMNSLMGRPDLRRATLLPWRHSLAPRALVRTHRAWCPVCLHDFARLGQTVYEPLVWRVADVTVCQHHLVRLEVQCPYCGYGRQPSFGAFARVGCCRACGKWLGRPIPDESTSVGELDVFLSRTVEEALSLSNVRDQFDLICSDVAVRALRDVFYCGSSAQMGRALGIQPSQVFRYAAGAFPAPLHLFVRASYATGATMEQIFVSNRFDEKKNVRRKLHFEVQRSVPHRARLGADLVVHLNSALAEGGKQSVGAVAAGLNITARTVWRHERELATRLARMHAEFIGRETQAQKEEYKAKAIAFITACAARRITPCRRQVDMECGGDGRFSTQWKRLIIREAIAESRHVAPAR